MSQPLNPVRLSHSTSMDIRATSLLVLAQMQMVNGAELAFDPSCCMNTHTLKAPTPFQYVVRKKGCRYYEYRTGTSKVEENDSLELLCSTNYDTCYQLNQSPFLNSLFVVYCVDADRLISLDAYSKE